ncbi:MAG: glycosyltransferase family 2 protein [Gelidibacter sp.]
MKIIAIIVAYNAANWIDKCFGSLINSSVSMDIMMIDNNSTDNSVELIRKNYPQVKVHESGINLGFGKANNLGIKMALNQSYDYVFLLNQDAWIEKNTVEKLIRDHLQNTEYGVIVPLQMNGSGTLLDSMFLKYTLANNRELLTKVIRESSKNFYPVDFANAACWLLPVSTIEKIGGFDPLFPHYGEDDDYLNRLKRHNLKVGLNISTMVFHDREDRKPKTTLRHIVNEVFTRELIEYKNHNNLHKSKKQILKDASISSIKFVMSGFKRYYVCQIIAYYKIFKIYRCIAQHRKEEGMLLPHYL